MSTPWKIAPGVERIDLGAQRRGEVTFTVSNPGPVDDRAVLDIACSENAERSWFAVSEPQRLVPHGGSVQFSVAVRPGEQAAAGAYWLAGRVYSADSAPEETAVVSDRVAFDLAGATPKPKKPIWIWLVPLIVMIAAVVGIVLFLLLRPDDPETVAVPDLTNQSLDQANQVLRQAGLQIQVVTAHSEDVPIGNVAGQDPAANQPVAPGTAVTVTVSLGKAPPATVTTTVRPTDIVDFCVRFPRACDFRRFPERVPGFGL